MELKIEELGTPRLILKTSALGWIPEFVIGTALSLGGIVIAVAVYLLGPKPAEVHLLFFPSVLAIIGTALAIYAYRRRRLTILAFSNGICLRNANGEQCWLWSDILSWTDFGTGGDDAVVTVGFKTKARETIRFGDGLLAGEPYHHLRALLVEKVGPETV